MTEYPTEEDLERIEKWDSKDCRGCLDFIRDQWAYPDYVTVLNEFEGERGLFYRFATGGWSGNESLIGALHGNHVITSICWLLHKRGGLHVYELPAFQIKKDVE